MKSRIYWIDRSIMEDRKTRILGVKNAAHKQFGRDESAPEEIHIDVAMKFRVIFRQRLRLLTARQR